MTETSTPIMKPNTGNPRLKTKRPYLRLNLLAVVVLILAGSYFIVGQISNSSYAWQATAATWLLAFTALYLILTLTITLLAKLRHRRLKKTTPTEQTHD